MAQYHYKAEQLKPLVEKAGFNLEQLNLIQKMMRGCTMLRQGKVIDSFLSYMLPEGYEIREGTLREGKYGMYRPTFVAKVGEADPTTVLEEEETDAL